MENQERENETQRAGRIFCIGRNYAEHIHELSNPVPERPVIFMKPATCLVRPGQDIHFPRHASELHHEVELVVKIGTMGRDIRKEDALTHVGAVTVGLDLTLRDLQKELKKKGLPWEMAKAFEQSAPAGDFIPCDETMDLHGLSFGCRVNGRQRQQGTAGDMIFSIEELIEHISRIWTLYPGDLIFTGTPAGVGPLEIGDTIEVHGDTIGSFSWRIIR